MVCILAEFYVWLSIFPAISQFGGLHSGMKKVGNSHVLPLINDHFRTGKAIRASCNFQMKRLRHRAVKGLAKTTWCVMELDLWFSGPLVSDEGLKKERNSIVQQRFGV